MTHNSLTVKPKEGKKIDNCSKKTGEKNGCDELGRDTFP